MAADREEIVKVLEDLVEADEKTVSLPQLKKRLAAAAGAAARGVTRCCALCGTTGANGPQTALAAAALLSALKCCTELC